MSTIAGRSGAGAIPWPLGLLRRTWENDNLAATPRYGL
jgi:hypothetical protein